MFFSNNQHVVDREEADQDHGYETNPPKSDEGDGIFHELVAEENDTAENEEHRQCGQAEQEIATVFFVTQHDERGRQTERDFVGLFGFRLTWLLGILIVVGHRLSKQKRGRDATLKFSFR